VLFGLAFTMAIAEAVSRHHSGAEVLFARGTNFTVLHRARAGPAAKNREAKPIAACHRAGTRHRKPLPCTPITELWRVSR
jgi:hypothetical protein